MKKTGGAGGGGAVCPRSDNDPSPEAPAPPPPPTPAATEGGGRPPARHPRGWGRPPRPAAGPSQAAPAPRHGRGPQPAAPGPQGGGGSPRGAARPGGAATKRRGPGSGGQGRQALTGRWRGSPSVPLCPARPAGPGRGQRAVSPLLSSPLSAPFRGHVWGWGGGGLRDGVAAAGRYGPGREGGSPAAARAGSGGRHRRRCSVRALGSFRPHQGRAGPRGPREAGRRERGRSPRRLVAILVLLLLRGAECPLPARLPALPPPSAPPPPPGWLRSPPLPRPGEAA